MAINGIIFDNQIPTASQMAAVMRQRFNDGIVLGAELTASGTHAYIAPGILIGCGRPFQITSQQTLQLSGTGYNHIIASLDMTGAATASSFAQVTFSVLANASQTVPSLTQEDINQNGTLYQFEVGCIQVSNGSAVEVVRTGRATNALREGVDYGTTLPASGVPGQLFFKIRGA